MSQQKIEPPKFKAIEWLDANPPYRKWFAGWLADNYQQICQFSSPDLDRKSWDTAFDGMQKAMRRLRRKMSELATAQQLSLLQTEASKWKLTISQEVVLKQLKFRLTNARGRPGATQQKGKEPTLLPELLSASPWAAEHASQKLMWENFGRKLCLKTYPRNVDCQLALQRIMLILHSQKVSPSSPEMERVQSALFSAVRVINEAESEAKRLSQLLVKTVKNWPRHQSEDPVALSAAKTRAHVSKQLQIAKKKGTVLNSRQRAMRQAIESALLIEDFRSNLFVLLLGEAERKSKGSTKVWQHLEAALQKAIVHACKPRSIQNQITRLVASENYALRRLKMSVFEAEFQEDFPAPISKNTHGPDEGQTSFDVMVRKAKKKLRKEYGLDFEPAPLPS